jgi:calcium release-activated calcium channel protein 1
MVEMDVKTEGDNKVPFPLLLSFIIVTTLLVSVHMLALMISTCILPHIEAVASLHDGESPIYRESPHEKMKHYTSIAWSFSTVVGIFLFLLELAIIVWVKFWHIDNGWVAIASTIMLIPVICAFVFFAFHFYRQLVAYKFEKTEKVLHELEVLAEQIHDCDYNNTNSEIVTKNDYINC